MKYPTDRRGAGLLVAAGLVLQLGACALLPDRPAEEPLYPPRAPARIDWFETISHLPPLEHERGGRWPLVLWHGVGFEPLGSSRIEVLLERGIVQHLRLREADVDAARALSEAGAPVVLMEGAGGAWPYDTVGDEVPWRLQFASGNDVPDQWRELPDPTRLEGWRRAAALIRSRLERYHAAGISVDAVWLDYEGALLYDDYDALRASRSADRLPASLINSEKRYRDYRRLHWLHNLSRYLAAPVRRVYPEVSVTNWVVMMSSSAHPVRSWTDWRHPPTPPLFFTHTNPIAYGVDTYFFSAWPDSHPVNRGNVDRFYTHLLLRQVSVDARNRTKHRPDMGAVAWVARRVPDRSGERAPVMSRAAYREALRHIWLRGVDAMQVFNPRREGYERYAVREVEDVQGVYNEMLAYRRFLDEGKVMNFAVPDNRAPSVMWSGLRLGTRAVVRVTNLGSSRKRVKICVDDQRCRNLPVTEDGRTYVLNFQK